MGVRPASRRLEKWDNNYAGDVLSERMKNYKDKMREQLSNIFPLQETLENEVKTILAEAGTSTILNPAYLNFGREVLKLCQKFSGGQLINAVDVVLNKWVARALDRDILERIRNTVFALVGPSP